MEHVYIPLQGPNGTTPKAPAVGAWQSPGYPGVKISEQKLGTWVGMRCDGLVVVDCDSAVANGLWRKIDPEAGEGWVRKTPRGMHYLYLQTVGSPDGPLVGVWPGIDIRAGRLSQVVVFADGYAEMHGEQFMRVFNPSWMPSQKEQRPDVEEWDEMPEGRGNTTMTAFAGAFRRQGMSLLTIAQCLGAINRITMTQDPMSSEDIGQIARSVARYTPDPGHDLEIIAVEE